MIVFAPIKPTNNFTICWHFHLDFCENVFLCRADQITWNASKFWNATTRTRLDTPDQRKGQSQSQPRSARKQEAHSLTYSPHAITDIKQTWNWFLITMLHFRVQRNLSGDSDNKIGEIKKNPHQPETWPCSTSVSQCDIHPIYLTRIEWLHQVTCRLICMFSI